MSRNLLAFLVPSALALLIALSGCGGGGGGGGGKTSTSTTGTSGNVGDGAGVVRDINRSAVVGAVVTFYNASGASVGKATVGRTGQVGTPPSGATSFSVSVTSLLASDGKTEIYYDTYLYGSLDYDGTVVGCLAPLTNGAFTSSVVFTPRVTGVPPSPPTGCSASGS